MNKHVKKILKFFYENMERLKSDRDLLELQTMLENEDFIPEKNEVLSNGKRILFIIPGIVRHMGGHTSILRIGTGLANAGYEVAYLAYSDQTISEMKKNAEVNLPDYKGCFYEFGQLSQMKADFIIATSWRSVYYARGLCGYKFYFVQDYEPYFFSYGDYYFLAKKTYELGYHIISLGAWNKQEILLNTKNRILSENIDVIDFPYEKSEYISSQRSFEKYKTKRKLKIAAYIKEDSKRLPLISQTILSHVKHKFESEGIQVDIFYYGVDKSVKVKDGINLGKLDKMQLHNLYINSDFGYVASMTNISLVPYEMISSGLPVIEMMDGSFPAFFNEKDAILCDFDANKLHEKIKYYCENYKELEENQKHAMSYISQFSWERTCQQFIDILSKVKKL